ncbi:MAG: hypothetical protein HDQ87_07685 [Clostridia bacterium]|nr:hypothetical protein [Clostridia bacterium]
MFENTNTIIDIFNTVSIMRGNMTENLLLHVALARDWFDWIFSPASFIVAVAAFVIAKRTHDAQKLHDRQSVRPILNIVVGDYEENLYVRIVNNGVGPALITKFTCFYDNDRTLQSKSNLYEIMPSSAMVTKNGYDILDIDIKIYSDFVEDVVGRAIAPGNYITLLQVKKDDVGEYLIQEIPGEYRLGISQQAKKKDEVKEIFERQKFVLRSCLSKCNIKVVYTDIYKSKKWKEERMLTFFWTNIET